MGRHRPRHDDDGSRLDGRGGAGEAAKERGELEAFDFLGQLPAIAATLKLNSQDLKADFKPAVLGVSDLL